MDWNNIIIVGDPHADVVKALGYIDDEWDLYKEELKEQEGYNYIM